MMSKHTKTFLEDLLNKFMVQQYSKNLFKNFIGLLIVLNDKEKQKFFLSLINCIKKKPIESEFWSQMSNEHKTILNRTVLWLFTKSTYKTVGAFNYEISYLNILPVRFCEAVIWQSLFVICPTVLKWRWPAKTKITLSSFCFNSSINSLVLSVCWLWLRA